MPKGFMTTNTLLESVKVRGTIPSAQITYTDDDLIRFANEETSLVLVPLILSTHEEFFVASISIPLVSNQNNYKIPYRAVGTKVRDVFMEDSSGNLYPMARIEPENINIFQNGTDSLQSRAFYIQGNELVLVPNVGAGVNGSLRIFYYFRPNDLVQEVRVGDITAIDLNTGEISVSALPSNITAASLIDFVELKPGHKTKGFDITVLTSNPSINTITIDPALIPSDLEVGDTLCSAGETKIPQIPSDLHVILAQCVNCRVLEAQGDTAGLQLAQAKLNDMQARLMNIIDSRTEGSPQKILNVQSFLRRGRYNYRRSGSF